MRRSHRQKPALANNSAGRRCFDKGETGITSTLSYDCTARAQWRSGFILIFFCPYLNRQPTRHDPSQLFVMVQLPILHWNDVYRVRAQKVSPTSSEAIDVTQFAGLIDDLRAQWPLRDDGKRDGLSLFSGDVFSPSVDSSVTRGSHMVRVQSPSLQVLWTY